MNRVYLLMICQFVYNCFNILKWMKPKNQNKRGKQNRNRNKMNKKKKNNLYSWNDPIWHIYLHRNSISDTYINYHTITETEHCSVFGAYAFFFHLQFRSQNHFILEQSLCVICPCRILSNYHLPTWSTKVSFFQIRIRFRANVRTKYFWKTSNHYYNESNFE